MAQRSDMSVIGATADVFRRLTQLRHSQPQTYFVGLAPDAFHTLSLGSYTAVFEALGAAMQRREFIGLVGGAVAAWPLAARAQQPKKIPRLGYLASSAPNNEYAEAFFQSLRELGYVDGVNIQIDVRYASGRMELLAGLANELISL